MQSRILLLVFVLSLAACGDDIENASPGIAPNATANIEPGNAQTNNMRMNNGANNANNTATSNSTPNGATNNETTNNSGGNSNSGTPIALPGWIGGESVDGRPVVVEHYGNSGPVLLILSAIHGTERLAVTFGERFRTELLTGYAERHGIQVVFMQSTNPDGVSRYERYNTNGIDLNRNFDTRNFAPGGTGGDTPLSEPEARAIKSAVDASGLTAAISVHCCAPIFDHDGPGQELAEEMSAAMASAYRFPEGKLGASPGSLGSYVGLDLGLPIITVEFARTEDFDPFPQLAEMESAFDAAGSWVRQNPGGGEPSADDFARLDTFDYASWYAGSSTGGIPLRGERVGPETGAARPNVVLSGLDGRHRRGTWIAEHTRRELLAFPVSLEDTWRFHTVVDPDAVAEGRAEERVRSALLDADRTVPEAAAALDSLDVPSRVFLIDNSTSSQDCVEIYGDSAAQIATLVPAQFDCGGATDDPLSMALAQAGHLVVRIVVDTETAEAQSSGLGTNTDFDTTIASPLDFSDFIFEVAGVE